MLILVGLVFSDEPQDVKQDYKNVQDNWNFFQNGGHVF